MPGQVQKLLTIYSRHLSVAAYFVFGLSVASVIWLGGQYLQKVYERSTIVETPDTIATTTLTNVSVYHLASSTPIRLIIPKLNLDATFETPLGLKADKTIEVPKEYTTVGWYKYGAAPGSIGPAVILGHVDSYKGAAVFYHLGQLAPGDRFSVVREDKTTAQFEVTELHRYLQSEFPTDLVYGKIAYAGIRLITCSGTYSKGKQRYDHNLVVYGKLIESPPVHASSTVAH